MLEGAKDMDNHFRIKSFEENIPMIMACIGIWYNNFHNCETHAIFPYDEYLKLFPSYIQQADMESNGKSITKNNNKTNIGDIILQGKYGLLDDYITSLKERLVLLKSEIRY